ncbi:hypothetical protein N7456_008607 [Penicillium angulare]|uniref:Uncharacterized protein n=1 Tax=Penicillium angulare TaxID=116970 RepID=A0A9W9K4Y0_9EURO|nr:hypothetical protein N7456_008607 [Penicillium angulare]
MVDFDWPGTLITSFIGLLAICLGVPSLRSRLKRLWGSLCDRLAQWRHSLPRINPGGTPDLEQGPDDHSTELDDLSNAILRPAAADFDDIPPPPPVLLPPPRVDRVPRVHDVAAADPPIHHPSPPSSFSSPSRRRSTRVRRQTQYYGR